MVAAPKHQVQPHGIAAFAVVFGERLVDHDGLGRPGIVARRNFPPGAQPNPQRREEAGVHSVQAGTGRFTLLGLIALHGDIAAVVAVGKRPAAGCRGWRGTWGKRRPIRSCRCCPNRSDCSCGAELRPAANRAPAIAAELPDHWSTSEKIAVLAPIPRARDNMALAANIGLRRRVRKETARSRIILVIGRRVGRFV